MSLKIWIIATSIFLIGVLLMLHQINIDHQFLAGITEVPAQYLVRGGS